MPSEDFVGHLVDLELDALLVLLVQDARQVDSYLLSEILGAHSFLTRSFCYFTPHSSQASCAPSHFMFIDIRFFLGSVAEAAADCLCVLRAV